MMGSTIDPVRAVIATAAAILVGVVIFLVRNRKTIGDKVMHHE